MATRAVGPFATTPSSEAHPPADDTAALVASFERDGFVVVPDAIPPAELVTLREATRRLGEESGQNADIYVQVNGFHQKHPSFLSLLDNARTLPVIVELLSWNIAVFCSHLDIYPQLRTADPKYRRIMWARDYAWDWHRDLGVMLDDLAPAPPRLALKAAFFLTDVVEPDSGELHVVPGSHRAPSVAAGPVQVSEGAARVPVRAGSALLFDTRLVHSRGPNLAASARLTLFLGYAYRWIRPRDELQLDPRVEDALNPVQRQLVGAGATSQSLYLPGPDDVPLRGLVDDRAWWSDRYAQP